jgi:glycosyltransferase involved in cell wall biosynthesis
VRIVQLIPTLQTGGLERIAAELTIALAHGGEDVVVCASPRPHKHTFEAEVREAGVQIVDIPRPRARLRDQLGSWRPLAQVLRSERPDVVHAHNPAALLAALAARLLARTPETAIVTTYHGLVGERSARGAVRALRRSDLVTAIGPAAADELLHAGLDPGSLVIVANGVSASVTRDRTEVRRELAVPEDAELVLTVGRYTPEKNQAQLLEAVALLSPRRPRLRALLVGVGPLEPELRERIRQLGLDGIVQLTGVREDAVDVAAAADVVTLTSQREGLGLALLEAMAVGTPVVGNRVGGIPDVVEDGVSGLLVPAGDATATAAAIERILDEPDLRTRLSSGGRARVAEHFSLDSMVQGYLAAYESARGRRSRRASRRAGASPSR